MTDASLDQPNPIVAEEQSAQAALGPVQSDHDRHRLDHRRGHFRHRRHGGRRTCGTGRAALLHHRGARLPVRRALLCRIRFDDSGIRQRLHLCLRHHGPLHGVVHRLEHGAGISGVRVHGVGRLVGLFRQLPAAISGYVIPPAFANAPVGGHGLPRHSSDGRDHQPARRAADRLSHSVPRGRRQRVRALQRADGDDQDGHRDPRDHLRPALCAYGQSPSVHSAQCRARSENSASRESSPPPA